MSLCMQIYHKKPIVCTNNNFSDNLVTFIIFILHELNHTHKLNTLEVHYVTKIPVKILVPDDLDERFSLSLSSYKLG